MFTQAPDITIDATVGQVIVAPTQTPTSVPSTSTSQATPTSSPTTSLAPSPTPSPASQIPVKRYKQNALVIYGYGPAKSEVSLKGFGVSEKTTTQENGFFAFGNIYSYTYKYPELCIQAMDSEMRLTQPSCIPALPNDSLIPLEVGPILLSPTISVSENNVKEGEESYLSGMTIPSSEINIFISKKDSNRLSLVNQALAYTLPSLTIKTDESGEYSVTLPTSDSAEYKIFASSKYGEDLTNKSNTLNFVVLTRLKTLLENIIELVLKNKFLALVFLEALVFVFLFVMALKSTTKSKKVHSEKDYLKFVAEYK